MRSLGLTRIVIVEDHELFAEALDVTLTLEGHDVHRLSLPAHQTPPGQLITAVLRLRPKVVLLDLDLGPTGNGVRLIEPLTRAAVAVIVVTGSLEPARWGECVRYGASTVMSKSTPLNTILATIRLITEGRRVLARDERERLLAAFHEEKLWVQDARVRLESLTMREREVLAHLMTGQQVRQIAKNSFVSEATVRTQVKSILAKLEVSSQLAAVGTALKARWRPPVVQQQK